MFYSYNITIPAATAEATASITRLFLSPGVIHQIDILFPTNANREVYVKILQAGFQLIPSNSNESIRANNTVISTREFFELEQGSDILTVKAWNIHATDAFMISVNIGVLPRKILQPFSFKELLSAALGDIAPVQGE